MPGCARGPLRARGYPCVLVSGLPDPSPTWYGTDAMWALSTPAAGSYLGERVGKLSLANRCAGRLLQGCRGPSCTQVPPASCMEAALAGDGGCRPETRHLGPGYPGTSSLGGRLEQSLRSPPGASQLQHSPASPL